MADLIIYNADIYTVDTSLIKASAVAIKADKILAVGDLSTMTDITSDETKKVDAGGKFLIPGFIEGHGHFSGLGFSIINLNLIHTHSWDEIVKMVGASVNNTKDGAWISGRGWHQEKWDQTPLNNVNGYPYHNQLSAATPNHPVILRHASGHALFANKKAMELAGISNETNNPIGGRIVRDHNGEAIGVFEERAMQLIDTAYQKYLEGLSKEEKTAEWYSAIDAAQLECLKNGVTSFQDAGSKFDELDRYKEMALSGKLDLRLWVMARHSYDEMKDNLKKYITIDAGASHYTCNAIKSEVDGALGSFGAWLIEPYSDKPGFRGQNTTSLAEVTHIAELAKDLNMQMCVHAIGDQANREVIKIYSQLVQNDKKERRWRIEHAQHIHPDDIAKVKAASIIASMQGIHCTSDAPFVEKRLGHDRSKNGAYAWRSFLDAGVLIANGTDTPVEDVNPIQNFYATVTRKRADTGFEFFKEQAMTRSEAVFSYTLGNAIAAFEEQSKGSISPGKLADFVLLDHNLLECTDEEILNTKVLCTIVGGQVKYGKISP